VLLLQAATTPLLLEPLPLLRVSTNDAAVAEDARKIATTSHRPHPLYAISVGVALNASGQIKPQHKLKAQVEKLLGMIADEETNLYKKANFFPATHSRRPP